MSPFTPFRPHSCLVLSAFFLGCSLSTECSTLGKCTLFAASICWCGRLISANEIKFDLRQPQKLLSMEHLSTGARPQQIHCAKQMLKNGIPNFTELIMLLHSLIATVYARADRRTKQKVVFNSLQSSSSTIVH